METIRNVSEINFLYPWHSVHKLAFINLIFKGGSFDEFKQYKLNKLRTKKCYSVNVYRYGSEVYSEQKRNNVKP